MLLPSATRGKHDEREAPGPRKPPQSLADVDIFHERDRLETTDLDKYLPSDDQHLIASANATELGAPLHHRLDQPKYRSAT